MKIGAGGNQESLNKVYPLTLNYVLAIGYSNIVGGDNWPCAQFCLSNLTTESFTYWIHVNDISFMNTGATIEKMISVFLIGI